MIKIYLHRLHPNFCSESLLFRTVKSLAPVTIVDRLAKADLIVAGPSGFYTNIQPLGIHRIPKIRNYILSKATALKTSPNQISFFYSCEPPSIGSFYSSNCSYGVSSELISDNKNHFRLPYWMESIDWSDYGIQPSQTDRVGLQCKPDDLTKERDGRAIINKSFELPIFTSHLNGFRCDVVKRLSSVVPIRGFGPYFDPSISHHSNSGFLKSQILSKYAFNLCPENTIYPGYITEKILEAYISSTVPITLVDPVSAKKDFNERSFINLYPVYDEMTDYLRAIFFDINQLCSIASQPLFNNAPTLDQFIAFLKRILEHF